MVRDAYFYALPLLAAAVLLGWLTSPPWAVLPMLLAFFFLWFFRDPERAIPEAPGMLVSPADGKVTDVSPITVDGKCQVRISIFLSVFDVHVNRSPIAGTIRSVQYRKGAFLNAMNAASAEQNGQNVVVKQIAGLLARRIVFNKKIGDRVQRGERIGLIKFGSRTDVVLDASANVQVKVGDKVKGGSSVLAFLRPDTGLAVTSSEKAAQGVR